MRCTRPAPTGRGHPGSRPSRARRCGRSTRSAWGWCARWPLRRPVWRTRAPGAGDSWPRRGRRGTRPSAIEPSARGAEAAAALGVPVQRATIAAADVTPGSLDAVTLWHVLEHLDDPGEALATIAGWLAPGGALLVGVPNLASLQARIGGDRWFHLDVPRHRVHFTPAGLSSAAGAPRVRAGPDPASAARAQPVRHVADARQPGDRHAVVPLQPAQAQRSAALAGPGGDDRRCCRSRPPLPGSRRWPDSPRRGGTIAVLARRR